MLHIDAAQQLVQLRDGSTLAYDHLIVAAGATHSYFGHDDWAPHAPGLKTLEDAFEIRRRVLLAFESAEKESDPTRRAAWLTFVVIGAGPTGVEMAGTLAEIARHTLPGEFRRIDPSSAQILLVEAGPRVLQAMQQDFSGSYTQFIRAQSAATRNHLLALPWAEQQAAHYAALAAESLAEQQRIEAADSMPFEQYRQAYLSPDRLQVKRPLAAIA